ncbi:hypothetical protein D9M69_712850 [compost metagenome]
MDAFGTVEEVTPVAEVVEGFQLAHQGVHPGRQLVGPRRGCEAARRTHEERVAELVAQLVQLVAEGRLTEGHARCGHGRIAFLVEHMEDQQQIQVLLGDIHFLEYRNKSFRIIES